MAGVLNFSLGLATGNFLPGARSALAAVTSLVSAGTLLSKIGREIAEGGRLFDEGQRLREAPSTLAKVGFALEQIGESSASAGPLISQINKALGGFSETGESTKEAFDGLGLSMNALQGMDADQKILAIGEALSKLPIERATNLAAKIVGRGGAQTILAVSNSLADFGEEMAYASKYAEVLGRNAKAFDKIGDSWNRIKLGGNTFFAGIAEGAAPGIQQAMDELNKMDVASIGQTIGNAIGIGVQAIKTGQLDKLVTLSLEVGFTKGFTFAGNLFGDIGFWRGVGETALAGFSVLGTGLIKLFTSAATIGSSVMEKTFGEIIENFTGGKLRQFLGIPADFKAENFETIFARNRRNSDALFNKLFGNNLNDALDFGKEGLANLGAALKRARAGMTGGPAAAELDALIKQLDADRPKDFEERKRRGGGAAGDVTGFGKRSEVSALERIGYINFRGNGGPDYQRRSAVSNEQVAANTRAMLKLTEDVLNVQKTIARAIGLPLVNK